MPSTEIWPLRPVPRRRAQWAGATVRYATVESLWEAALGGEQAQLADRRYAWFARSAEADWTQLDDATLSLLQRVAELHREVMAVQNLGEQPLCTQAALHELGAEWQLERPIYASIETYTDHTIARVADLNVFGEGGSDAEAVEYLRSNLVELAQELETMEPGSELAQRWGRVVRRVPVATTR